LFEPCPFAAKVLGALWTTPYIGIFELAPNLSEALLLRIEVKDTPSGLALALASLLFAQIQDSIQASDNFNLGTTTNAPAHLALTRGDGTTVRIPDTEHAVSLRART
jgi:hypothetical protein